MTPPFFVARRRDLSVLPAEKVLNLLLLLLAGTTTTTALLGFIPPPARRPAQHVRPAALPRPPPPLAAAGGRGASSRPPPTSLPMGYLDDLSPTPAPQQPPDDDDGLPNNNTNNGWGQQQQQQSSSPPPPQTPQQQQPGFGSSGSPGPGGTTTTQPYRRTGGIPSGRGPEASYLDTMAGSGAAAEAGAGSSGSGSSGSGEPSPYDDHDRDDDDTYATSSSSSTYGSSSELPRAEGWSDSYLTNFLTPDGKNNANRDDSRTDIRNLLTQRSIQSFMRLLEECRDPHSAKWIQEDFLQSGNLLDYHGTGAAFIERYGGTWDAPLVDMVRQQKTRMIISAKRRGRGHGGWSKNNPYLKERWVEIPVDIDPSNLASRILEVREQIAAEWLTDLDVLIAANGMILDSYFAKVKSSGTTDDLSGAGGTDYLAFDRTAVNLINDNSRSGMLPPSSPFRRANFDLLYDLCTQAAVHRILREGREESGPGGAERDPGFVFLRDFYSDRAAEYFDGELSYGRADDFIDELLQMSPSTRPSDDGKMGLVDPVGTAERIIRKRSEVAEEWKGHMRNVERDHTGIRKALLSRQVQTYVEPGGGGVGGGHTGQIEDGDGLAFQ